MLQNAPIIRVVWATKVAQQTFLAYTAQGHNPSAVDCDFCGIGVSFILVRTDFQQLHCKKYDLLLNHSSKIKRLETKTLASWK